MSDIIADAARWLAGRRKAVMSRTVLWRRGGQSASVAATVGRAIFQTETQGGRVEQIEARTFTINVDEMIAEPRERDEIVETMGGRIVINSIMAPGGMPAVVWADDERTAWKVFTKVISQSEAIEA